MKERRGSAAALRHQLRLFFIALQFFTRLPIPRWVGFEAQWLQQASRYFPAVGIVVGLVASGVYAAAILVWPQAVAVLLSTSAGIYLTGAFHEDGFADACDGLGGGATPQRVLEIMKDSRLGAYGAIGIALMLALKCASLAALPAARVPAALLLAHPLSRLVAVSLIWRLRYAKEEGKAKPLATQMRAVDIGAACMTVGMVVAVLGMTGRLTWLPLAASVIAAFAVADWLARKFMLRIGGYTGDCLGAVQQASEAACYLALLAFAAA
jgi:adenosylcobinamide-GDP ribazoletransferase